MAYRGLPITMILLTTIGSVGHAYAQTTESEKQSLELNPVKNTSIESEIEAADIKSLNNTPARLKANPALIQALKNLGQKYAAIEEIHPVIKALKDPSARFADGEELIFAIIVDNLKLGEIFGFKEGKGARLGFIEYVTALDLAIKLDNTLDDPIVNYSGWFINEDNSFSLSIDKASPENSHVLIKGERIPIPAASYQVDFDDIYIDTAEMSRWFGIGVEYNYVDLSIRLSPQNQLPVQARLARRNRDTGNVSNRRQAKNILRDNGYQLVSPITEDMVISVSQSETDTRYSYSLLGAQDFAFMKTEYFYTGNDKNLLNDGRLSFSKESVEGDLLGIGATQFAIGDVAPKGITGGTSGRLSQGFSVSNRKIGSVQSIDSTSVAGAMKVGWDVELYRNGILLERENNVEDGRYEFEDIPLFFGENRFELVFYGPQGQIRKEQFTRMLDKSIFTNNGVFDFSFNALEKTLLGIRDIDTNAGYLAAGTYDSVIGEKILLSTGISSQFGGDEELNTLSLRASTYLFDKALFGLNYYITDAETQNLSGTFRTRLGSHQLSSSVGYNEAKSKDIGNTNSSYSAGIILGGNLANFSDSQISYQSRLQYFQSSTDSMNLSITNSLGMNILGANVNGAIVFNKVDIDNEVTQTSELSLGFQRPIGPVYTSIQSNFNLNDGSVESLSSQLSYDFSDNIQSKLTLQTNLSSKQSRYNLDVRWRQELFDLSSKLSFSDLIGWNASMFIRFGMSFLDDSKKFVMDRRGMASKGTVATQLFIDENMNGIFDDFETALENVKVEAMQGYSSGISDENGIAMISGLFNNKVTDINIDAESLPDPYLVPTKKAFSIRARSGFVDVVNIPLAYSSEIDGTLFIERDGNISTLPYAKIDLKNSQGDIVKTIESEFDGYYLFTEIIPGDYYVSVDSSYLASRNIQNVENRLVSLGVDGEISSGQDFILRPKQYTQQYVVTLGEFVSSDVMLAYWQILKSHSDDLVNITPFQVPVSNNVDDVTKQLKSKLGIQWFSNKKLAESSCEELLKKNISCAVETYSMEVL